MSAVDKPAESAVERYNALEWVPDGEMGFDPGGREVKAAADAALAELKAERDAYAEAASDANLYKHQLAALQAENEALKCCGNCAHIYEEDSGADIGYLFCDGLSVAAWSRQCQYDPSRWQRRES